MDPPFVVILPNRKTLEDDIYNGRSALFPSLDIALGAVESEVKIFYICEATIQNSWDQWDI